MLKISVKSDLSGVYKKIDRGKKKAQMLLDQQVIKDSNYFAPQDIGTLQSSALSASSIGKGRIVWDTPYARKLYWGTYMHFSHDKNPRARALWFEAAKSQFISDWVKIAKVGYK